MRHYNHFTTEEREKSRVLKEKGYGIRAIARELNRSPSSVKREFDRNTPPNGEYAAYRADSYYKQRRKKCGKKPKLYNTVIRDYVIERMHMRWTPEEIAGRAKLEKQPFSISYPTIYRAVDSGVLPKSLKNSCALNAKTTRNAEAMINVEK